MSFGCNVSYNEFNFKCYLHSKFLQNIFYMTTQNWTKLIYKTVINAQTNFRFFGYRNQWLVVYVHIYIVCITKMEKCSYQNWNGVLIVQLIGYVCKIAVFFSALLPQWVIRSTAGNRKLTHNNFVPHHMQCHKCMQLITHFM